MADRLIGTTRLFDRPVEVWSKAGRVVARTKVPLKGWIEGELTPQGMRELQNILALALAECGGGVG